ncbi:LEAF RUST 10 DISEASE-RESISTANCE LOCUS RECEPTOR-LIKE PROTEIN KINASE-like 2.1 isoform X1 [Andrographis paniculata]|uniref:LEAF RUST 10 DISEASE-RESISTANCE LOCUS RECEPTOR-LIKE PROTEIN KINASE-like 2.1 isoform X1 n=1 Tax=Andrographis paniculata TaxID=175694 RepID=UPI0021E7C7B1|nr:LEAF RUST 10 DISEASE-RESISTANCE LOCUS RECEPTOR-LIKE PROTEIN KINASE-like 2.1 isoform X1 [Andrographis paniculata]
MSVLLIHVFFLVVLQLIFVTYVTPSRSQFHQCPPSSCGNITRISYPFRLSTDPSHCGLDDINFQLDCHNNQTLLNLQGRDFATRQYISTTLLVLSINYEQERIRVVDPACINNININTPGDLSSCSSQSYYFSYSYSFYSDGISTVPLNKAAAFIHCLSSPIANDNNNNYVRAPFFGNTTKTIHFGNSSRFYSYVVLGYPDRLSLSDLQESCTVDKVLLVSARSSITNKSSFIDIYEALAYGFELSWRGVDSEGCWLEVPYFTLAPNHIVTERCCAYGYSSFLCRYVHRLQWTMVTVFWTIGKILSIRLAIGFMVGFPLLLWLVIHKWRRRHLCNDTNIEKFLQDQHDFAPIKYSYSDVKKMTSNFNEKLGEGGYGTVYKGKLRSGLYVAVKMLDQTIAGVEEFINEVGTIGRIHHVNVVHLVGFCIERSKYALVYEFLPNGSLDRYIFNEQSLGVLALTLDKMFEIALGVARGIGYLHHGCDMQILHFDIKPHNILLDENFNPKISDFGLARLHPTNESFINLTGARGTMGYMAPEIFYRNMGGISYKADIYSFGMMLMEMAGKKKIMNDLVEERNRMYFPMWIYDQLCAGKDIEMKDASEEEKRMVKKIMIVAMWCIQMRPSDRLPINKVIEMLESESEPRMPSRPFAAPREIEAETDDHGTQTYLVDCINLDLLQS